MKTYNFKLAKKTIQKFSDYIESASMGMIEDWFYTGQTVYEDNKFIFELDKKDFKLGGINSSNWATPGLLIEYKDGRSEMIECFTGTNSGKKPKWLQLGCLSSPCQDAIDDIVTPKLEN